MKIKDIPENTAYYVAAFAFGFDNEGNIWIDGEYRVSEKPNFSRCIEIVMTPDHRVHINAHAQVLKQLTLKKCVKKPSWIRCCTGTPKKKKVEEGPILRALW